MSDSQAPAGGAALLDQLRETTAGRIGEAVRRMLLHASDDTIHAVLRESTDIGSIIQLLSKVGIADVATIDPLAEAYLRGTEMKQRLLEEAGGVYTTGEVARLLGISEQAVHARRSRGKLLAMSVGNDRHRFPTCQFTSGGVLSGIDDFLAACNVEDSWTQLALLIDPQPALQGKSILDALRAGRREDALRIAGQFAA